MAGDGMMLPPRMIMTNPMSVTVSSTQTNDFASSLVLPARCTQGSSFLFQQSILLLSDLHVCNLLLPLLVFLHEGNIIKPRQDFTSLCAIISHLLHSFSFSSFSGFLAFCHPFPHVRFTLYFFLCFR